MKKVFNIIAAAVAAIVGIFLITRKSSTPEKIEKIDDSIKEKEERVEEVKAEAEVIEKTRKRRKKNAHYAKKKAANLEEKKQNIQPIRPATAQAAKENILSKTNANRKPKA
jgi:cell division protein FtsL